MKAAKALSLKVPSSLLIPAARRRTRRRRLISANCAEFGDAESILSANSRSFCSTLSFVIRPRRLYFGEAAMRAKHCQTVKPSS
jgi:hypothetical protein